MPEKQRKRGRLWLNDGSCIRLRSATLATQLGRETSYALTFQLDQSTGAGQREAVRKAGAKSVIEDIEVAA